MIIYSTCAVITVAMSLNDKNDLCIDKIDSVTEKIEKVNASSKK